jgi:hypothetical protein
MSRVQSFTSMAALRKSECCNVPKKLNLTFDMLTDLHLMAAEQCRLVSTLPGYLRIFTSRSAMHWTGSIMSRSTDCPYRHGTWSTSKGSSAQPMLTQITQFARSLPKLSSSCGCLTGDWPTLRLTSLIRSDGTRQRGKYYERT